MTEKRPGSEILPAQTLRSYPSSSGSSGAEKPEKKRTHSVEGDDGVIGRLDMILELTDGQLAAMTREQVIHKFKVLQAFAMKYRRVEREWGPSKHAKRCENTHGLSTEEKNWKPVSVAATTELSKWAKAWKKGGREAACGDIDKGLSESGKVEGNGDNGIVVSASIATDTAVAIVVGETLYKSISVRQEIAFKEQRAAKRGDFASKNAKMTDSSAGGTGSPVGDGLPNSHEDSSEYLAKALADKAEPIVKPSSLGAILPSPRFRSFPAPATQKPDHELSTESKSSPPAQDRAVVGSARAIPPAYIGLRLRSAPAPSSAPIREAGAQARKCGFKPARPMVVKSPCKGREPVATIKKSRSPRCKLASSPKAIGEKSMQVSREGAKQGKRVGGSSRGDAIFAAREQSAGHRQDMTASLASSPVSPKVGDDGFVEELAKLLKMLTEYKAKLDGGSTRTELETSAVTAQALKVEAFPMTLVRLKKTWCGRHVAKFVGELRALDRGLAVNLLQILIEPWKKVEAGARFVGMRAAVEGMLFTNFKDITSAARGGEQSCSSKTKLAESVARCAKEGADVLSDRVTHGTVSLGDAEALSNLGFDVHGTLMSTLKAAKKVGRRRAKNSSPDAASEVKNRQLLDFVEDFIAGEITAELFFEDMLAIAKSRQ